MRALRTQPRQPLAGFDLNGVLAEANESLWRIAAARWGVRTYDRDRYDGILQALLDHGVRQPGRWIKGLVNDPDFILSLPADEALLEAWRSCGLPRRVVTGHDPAPETQAATRAWLAAHGIAERCDFTRDKAGWARQTRASVVVEDGPARALEIAEAGCRVIVPARTYNASVRHDRILRVEPHDISLALKEVI